jgi:hypothetical protein
VNERHDSPLLWIYLPLAGILVLNILLFVVYHFGNPTLQIWTQVWNYLASDIFKILTVSLLIPIFLFLLEKKFRILEKREEEIKLREEERKKRQIESLKQSSDMWKEFQNLVNEVAFFDIFDNNIEIRDVLVKLENSNGIGVDVVNSWRVFNLKEEEVDQLLYLQGFLYFAAKSVAGYISESEKEDDKEEILELQKCLRVIQNIIGRMLYSIGISLLTSIMKLVESDIDKEEREETKNNILHLRQLLLDWGTMLRQEELVHNNLIAGYEGPEISVFRDAANSLKSKMLAKSLTDISSEVEKEFKKFNESFNQLSFDERLSVEKFAFSKQFIYYLGSRLGFESVLDYFLTRIKNEYSIKE